MAYEREGAARARLEFGPPPAAFPRRDIELGDRDPVALSERGLCYLLSETLVDLTEPVQKFSSRVVQQVTGNDGLQPSASFEVTFDPGHERLIIHTASVIRDGDRREAASAAAFELLRRELNLERAVYDGRLTAHMIIPDVRVGDQVETSYTIVGANPALKGRFSQRFRLQWSAPTIETDCRLRLPEGREIEVRRTGVAPEAEATLVDGIRTLRWRLIDAPPYVYDNDTPAWWIGHAEVHVADRMDWADVADLFRDAYAPPEQLPADMDAEIARLAERFPDAADRTAEALRFVQTLLRYHSIGVGAGGFRPRSVADIWSSRYGDCKDASRLLSVILNRLGVEACPALVNTRTGQGLKDQTPYAVAFDHCIVRATVDGRAWWLDATGAPQAGRLSNLTSSTCEWGLPLMPGATLEAIPRPPRQVVLDTRETWTFGRTASDPAELDMRSTYRAWRADDMRRWRANEGFPGVSRRMREGLEGVYGELVELEALRWDDKPEANQLELVERYTVGRPYAVNEGGDAGVRFESRDDIVDPTLTTIERARRDQPINIGAPRTLRTERLFHFPVKPQISPWRLASEGPGVRFLNEFIWLDDRRARHVLEIDVAQSIVPVEAVQDYFAFLRKIRASNGVSFTLETRHGKLKNASVGQTNWRSWAWGVGVLIAFGLLRFLLTLS